jgi:histidinol-phosphate/aromatic aminotransferase/cobyric acid decarboxylase-like protein
MTTTLLSDKLVVAEAGEGRRAEIFRFRHEVYASELGQHAENEMGELRDGLDGRNVYLVVERGGELAGFVSVTPPTAGMYSVDKYFRRGELPFGVDGSTWEIRLLTVRREDRGSEVALLLMLAAFRWVEARGGRRVMAIGRKEVAGMYVFRAFRTWLRKGSRVLILDPTYGEYAHVLERVIGCEVVRLRLVRENGWEVDPVALRAALAEDLELAVIVNPNSPTGRLIPVEVLRGILAGVPRRTRVWVDETYTDFCGTGETVERDAVASANVVVCKSMSKAYALSGARVAYLAAGAHQLEGLRAVTPPWVVSLPAQVAAVRALESPEYYAGRWAETGRLREALAAALRGFGWRVLPGSANFLLCELPESGPTAAEVVRGSRVRGLFLRDAKAMGSGMGERMVRVAVKSGVENAAMVGILGAVLAEVDGRWEV